MEKVKSCFDCFHCRVSAKSTEKRRLCFCDETVKRVPYREAYWRTKKVCKSFEDMGDEK